MSSKPTTRRTLLARRDAMGFEERAAASARIAEVVSGLVAGRTPEIMALYCAKGSEVDTLELDRAVRAAGWTVVYPRVGAGRAMTFHAVARDELVRGRFGLMEPAADAPAAELDGVTVAVVPGLAFDRDGARIGWGRGHYDTVLVAMPQAWRIGIAFACQMIDEIPSEPHDERMHVVVTEVATHAVGA